MIRTQISLPDETYERAKSFCARKEISLAELCRRSLEEYLLHWPSQESEEWTVPVLSLGEFLAPESDWRLLANEAS